MSDLLVKLYEIEPDTAFISEQASLGISIRKPIGPEKRFIVAWVGRHFPGPWASEADVALSRVPGGCFIAASEDTLLGFACYDATALGYFGPIGVLEEYRGKRTGTALLLACLLDMKWKGYGYAIVGHSGASPFFEKAANAVEIPDSSPGIYRHCLGIGER
jgi:GNAT superfamily N-acetyltransferase